MKRFFIFVLLLAATLFFAGCQAKPATEIKKSDNPTINQEVKVNQTLKFPGRLPDEKIKNKIAVVKTSKGTFKFELFADKAPLTVSNFVYLAELGYYNNLVFHRVVPGFVIQGGDPTGTGAGGPGYEFADETVQGDYKKGTVAMANAGPDTNGSQFFVCLEDQPNLPKQYNLFGQVTEGMDVVGSIQIGDKIEEIKIEQK